MKAVDILVAEHGLIRQVLESLTRARERIERSEAPPKEGNEIAITALLENLAAYISILKRHIHKEDHIFFRMVEEALSEEQDRMLLLQFGREEEKTGHENFFEENRKLALEMKALIER